MTDNLEARRREDEQLKTTIQRNEDELRKDRWGFYDQKQSLSETELKHIQDAIREKEQFLIEKIKEKVRRIEQGIYTYPKN